METPDPSRIVLDPAILAGKPIIRGTRIAVEFVIGLMADGWGEPDILANYPGVVRKDVIACLYYTQLNKKFRIPVIHACAHSL